jgi:hypothetical protein
MNHSCSTKGKRICAGLLFTVSLFRRHLGAQRAFLKQSIGQNAGATGHLSKIKWRGVVLLNALELGTRTTGLQAVLKT